MNGRGIENIDLFPFVLSLSKHELGFAGQAQKAFIIPGTSKYLLAIMNSSVVMWLFTKLLAKLQNEYYEPSAIFMKDFPIPSTQHQAPVKIIIDQILTAKAKDPATDVSALEAEIDQIVYVLYGLTKDEIALIEQRS